MTRLWPLLLPLLLAACTTSPPRNTDDICAIFKEKRGWYHDAAEARDAWGSPIPVMMAIIHQESRFQARVRPPRKKILGFIPGLRPSDAYGYSQAKQATWKDYQRSAGRYGADRHDFADAIDFVGWYNFQSYKRNGIPRDDSYRLYLAYHEGHGGYRRRSYSGKKSVMAVARKVARRADSYQRQLVTCENSLVRKGWFFGWF